MMLANSSPGSAGGNDRTVLFPQEFMRGQGSAHATASGGGHGDGTGDDMSEITREEFDAKLGQISAETDTKIVRMEGKIDLVLSKLDHVLQDNVESRSSIRDEQRSTRANVWVVGVGLAAIIIAMAVAFPTFFGMGAQVKDMATQAAKDAVQSHIAPTSKP